MELVLTDNIQHSIILLDFCLLYFISYNSKTFPSRRNGVLKLIKLYLTEDGRKILEIYLSKQGLTKSDFATMIGISRAHLTNILQCKQSAGKKTAKKIADSVSCEIEDIFLLSYSDTRKNYRRLF